MILIAHIIIALSSICVTTALAFWPSPLKLRLSAGLIGLTLATGTYLVISMHSPLLSACMTGLIYLAVALSGVGVGYWRLATAKQLNR
jgi:hypothetical protein